jgi:hypothetical protein
MFEANTRVTNGIPLGSSLLLPVCTVNCVQTLKDMWEKAKAGGKYSMVDKLDGTRAIAYGIQSHVGAVRLAL